MWINSLELISITKNIDRLLLDAFVDEKSIESIYKNIKLKNYKQLSKLLYSILDTGISGKVFVNHLLQFFLKKPKLQDIKKSQIINEIINIECSIIDGSNEYIQLFTTFINISEII